MTSEKVNGPYKAYFPGWEAASRVWKEPSFASTWSNNDLFVLNQLPFGDETITFTTVLPFYARTDTAGIPPAEVGKFFATQVTLLALQDFVGFANRKKAEDALLTEGSPVLFDGRVIEDLGQMMIVRYDRDLRKVLVPPQRFSDMSALRLGIPVLGNELKIHPGRLILHPQVQVTL